MKKFIFPAWLAGVMATWSYLIAIGPGLALYATHWLYPLMMIGGAAVAGFTPEGGGAVAYPLLSLYTDLTPQIGRDFSLAIQAIGMISAAIYIITQKHRPINFYRYVPLYVGINLLTFLVFSSLYSVLPIPLIQMLFVCLAVAFILSFWITKQYGTDLNFIPDTRKKIIHTVIFCGIGGATAALFGTGSDMLLYVLLSVYYKVREEEATDLSIITMGAVSLLATLYKAFIIKDFAAPVYDMWLSAFPVVAIFAPLGNYLLRNIKKSYMLVFVLILNVFNYVYWSSNNTVLIIPSICVMIVMTLFFTHARFKHEV